MDEMDEDFEEKRNNNSKCCTAATFVLPLVVAMLLRGSCCCHAALEPTKATIVHAKTQAQASEARAPLKH